MRESRRQARMRVQALLEDPVPIADRREAPPQPRLSECCVSSSLAQFLAQSRCALSPLSFVLLSLLLGCISVALLSFCLSLVFVPVFFLGGTCLPFLWAESRIRANAAEFAADYPTVLMAAASSLKAGMTPYAALERSTRLLARESLVRQEVEKLLASLRRGKPREQAAAEFAAGIQLDELELFRSAFLLAMENGGRFASTLKRLADVSQDRSVLIRSAQVTTANMRMTANFLIAVAPLIIGIVSLRNEDYWQIFLANPTANTIASTGIVIIAAGYLILRRMSDFKP